MGWSDQAELYCSIDKQVIESGVPQLNIEEPQTTPTGKITTLLTSKTPMYNSKGKIIGILGTYIDITERKQAEAELEETREKYRGLSEASYEAIFISEKGLCVEQNLAAEMMFGYTSEEAIGRYGTDWIVPEDREMVMNKMISSHVDVYEARALRKDGSSFPCIIQGKMMHYKGLNARVTSITDITERKNAFDALRKSEEKYKTMMNASPDGILLTDLKGLVTDISEIGIELFGIHHRSEIIGKHFYRFIPSEEKHTLREILKKTTSEGISQNTEMKIRKVNQSLFLSEISSTLIQGPDGKPFSFMIIMRDISQRKKLESKQIHADRMASLGEMASGIAHEIMQPLNTMSFVLDNVVFQASKVENVEKEYLKKKSDKIFENITRIRTIIDHIRAFSQSRDNYIYTNFDVNSSIKNAVSMITEQFKHLAIDLNLSLEKSLPNITGNSFQFEQVILNLLINAKDALLEKKNKLPEQFDMFIEINTFQENNYFIIEIADNGPGIDKGDLEHIMLPFYTTKETGKGTGLGLSISYQIIKEMNGSIEVMNNGYHGATFKIILEIQNKV